MASARDRAVLMLQGDSRTDVERRNLADENHARLLMSFCLRRTSNCLDVGASHGLFLTEICRLAPNGYHIAYEPIPALHNRLVERFRDVEIRQRALSNADATATFVHVCDETLEGYSGLKRRPYPRDVATELLTVETERLDGHTPAGWFPSFVKIDVEGAEILVLDGAGQTLREAKPIIAFEHGANGCADFGGSDDELHKLITQGLGLRLFDMDGVGPLDRTEFEDKLATGNHWNWIAHE